MKQVRVKQGHDEPVGIVISAGCPAERPPAVWAYVWGPAPELPAEELEPAR